MNVRKIKKQKVLRPVLAGLLLLCMFISMAAPAFAANKDPDASPTTDIATNNGEIIDSADWGDRRNGADWNDVIRICQTIGLVLCVISVAVGGLMLIVPAIFGGESPERSIEKGKSIIKVSIIAFLCLLLLPAVIKAAAAILDSGFIKTWEPPTLKDVT